MNERQKMAIRCAFADLIGAVQAYRQGDYLMHDWDAHVLSIEELKAACPWLDDIPDNIYEEV